MKEGFTHGVQVNRGTGGVVDLIQKIELGNCADMFNRQMTLSFWARSSVVTQVLAYIAVSTTGTDSYTFPPASYFNLTTNWQYITVVLLTPNLYTTSTNPSGYGMMLFTRSGAPTNSIQYYTGVQLEKGTVATPFEFRPFATELALCQRYYSNVSIPAGHTIAVATAGNTNCQIVLPIPVPLRSTPAIATTGTFSFRGASADNIITAFTINSTSQNLVNMTGALTNTAGNGVVGGVMSLNTNVTIALSSEL
jgi:hypothetical protein